MSFLSQKQLASDIEHQLSFSFVQYNKKRDESNLELNDWESFVMGIAESVIESNGSVSDGIFLAEDAFSKL